jgi:hypothetical protein
MGGMEEQSINRFQKITLYFNILATEFQCAKIVAVQSNADNSHSEGDCTFRTPHRFAAPQLAQ